MSRHHRDEPGLRRRFARQATGITSQHRKLDVFIREVSEAFERGQWRDLETAVFQLQGALNAHFAVEEQVVFPALHGLHADLANEVMSLERDHERLRQDLDRLAFAIVASDITTVRVALEEFDAALTAHERTEERILENA